MRKNDYLANEDVRAFVDWLVAGKLAAPFGESSAQAKGGPLRNLKICLNLHASRFVPGGMSEQLTGLEEVVSRYVWRSFQMQTGNWAETNQTVNGLSQALLEAMSQSNDAVALEACEAILRWGGNRNWNVGAWPFLSGLHDAGTLCNYFLECSAALNLNTADLTALPGAVQGMNAMLTKVHALQAGDGLPIYDSRVAAAIAALVELWRVSSGRSSVRDKEDSPLPDTLMFPATMKNRTVHRLFPQAIAPGLMFGGYAAVAGTWSSAKVRLGWILEEVLSRSPKLFTALVDGKAPTFAQRMRAFEAALFMVGYDIRCIGCSHGVVRGRASARQEGVGIRVNDPLSSVDIRQVMPLSGRGTSIQYRGSVAEGFEVVWGQTRFELTSDQMADIQSYFGGHQGIALGAMMDGGRLDGTFGQWLVDNGYSSRRFASPVAAILHSEGIVTGYEQARGIRLDFAE